MKITIYVPQEVTISDKHLPAILKNHNERWEETPAKSIEEVADEDILIAAQLLDLVDLPDDYRC